MQERACAAVDGRSSRQHIVDEDQAPASHRGLAVRQHAKRTLDIGRPLGPREAELLRGAFYAFERAGAHRQAGFFGNCGREHSRRIETPRP